MDFLKTLFGNDPLTYDQLVEKLKGAGKDGKDMKLADLSQGEYVSIEKFRALETERDDTRGQLETAKGTIDEMQKNAPDVESIQQAADAYKAQAEQAEQSAAERVATAEYRTAAVEAASSLHFSSNSAKTAFINALVEKKLPVEEGKLAGFTDFEKSYKESDPDAFRENGNPPPQIVASTTPPPITSGWREKLAANIAATQTE